MFSLILINLLLFLVLVVSNLLSELAFLRFVIIYFFEIMTMYFLVLIAFNISTVCMSAKN